jgi:hypothetical protein
MLSVSTIHRKLSFGFRFQRFLPPGGLRSGAESSKDLEHNGSVSQDGLKFDIPNINENDVNIATLSITRVSWSCSLRRCDISTIAVVLDVNRSLKRFPRGIEATLTRPADPALHYYHCYQDVAITFLAMRSWLPAWSRL